LDLAKNQLSNVGPLATVNGLSLLKLSDNSIEDIAPLAKQTQIRMLLLERNKISDLGTLVAAAKADAEGEKRFAPFLRLYLSGNPLSEAARSEQLRTLQGYGVRIEDSEKQAAQGTPADSAKP
jgi:Leucine-rich repeat (LRR) protein